jgi:hypothetical protein
VACDLEAGGVAETGLWGTEVGGACGARDWAAEVVDAKSCIEVPVLITV